MTRIWVLGAPDPEMVAIERLLREHGQTVLYAVQQGARVQPHTAYEAEAPALAANCYVAVECGWVGDRHVVRVDHHREGDPGYGVAAMDFLDASSIGQVYRILIGDASGGSRHAHYSHDDVHWYVTDNRGRLTVVPADIVLTAAADHCLAAAYRGKCPCVDPDALMRWRAESRAIYQRRNVADVLADVEATTAALLVAPVIDTAGVRNMCREAPWPELPEAAARAGVGYVSGPIRQQDGSVKYTCCGTAEQVSAWMDEQRTRGLAPYGDPARGFAGVSQCVHARDQVR
ncbi:MAG: hypothetical protein IT537_03310 [Hyphomicrobiales bacterium]|nr:hypothetical protein [Hyphomicrobiales bacterium]